MKIIEGERTGSKFAILLTSNTCEYIVRMYGGMDGLFYMLLRDPGEIWNTFPVVNGIFPSDEEVEEYDGFIVTGSRLDAFGDEKWILELCELLQKIHERKKKILGICFGHQVLSRALGGEIGRAPCGWEIGLKKVEVSDAFLSKPYGSTLPSSLNIIQAHRDQVFEVPPDGEVLASSENTAIEIFAVGEHVLGIQGHPEFTEDVFVTLMDLCASKGIMKEELASAAKASIAKEGDQTDRDLLQRLCKAFLKGVQMNDVQDTAFICSGACNEQPLEFVQECKPLVEVIPLVEAPYEPLVEVNYEPLLVEA